MAKIENKESPLSADALVTDLLATKRMINEVNKVNSNPNSSLISKALSEAIKELGDLARENVVSG